MIRHCSAVFAQITRIRARRVIGALHRGIKSHPSVTHLSRQVVTIFLSRRLPSESFDSAEAFDARVRRELEGLRIARHQVDYTV